MAHCPADDLQSNAVPLSLLRSRTDDLVSNLEAQLLRAKAVTGNITAYHQTRHPREITKIVRHLERIRQLNHDMTDILLAANVALDEAALLDDEPV